MSSREPLWYCHQCRAEMRPLMTPDPTCASCRGSFVEKMENPDDDPRQFHQEELDTFGPGAGIEPLLLAFQSILENRASERPSSARSPSGISFQIRSSPSGRMITVGTSGRARSPTSGPGGIPNMSEYLQRDVGDDGPQGQIGGRLMAQYLMTLLGRDPLTELLGGGMDGDPTRRGQMGDYVFSQEALDRIITQLMENANASRPVPATEEVTQDLPREVLENGSPMLEKDCAVCKEQFQTGTEDPDEQIVVTLPCQHPFHEPCILPWLKSSGTCPVCRHQLVPQPSPEHPPNDTGSAGPSGSPPNPRPSPSPRPSHSNDNGILHSLFGYLSGNRSSNASENTRSNPSDSSHSRDNGPNLPGRWEEMD